MSQQIEELRQVKKIGDVVSRHEDKKGNERLMLNQTVFLMLTKSKAGIPESYHVPYVRSNRPVQDDSYDRLRSLMKRGKIYARERVA